MSDIFPKWTNKLPAMVIVGGLLAGGVVTAGVTYYFTPKYSRVGYKPIQPVAFSHAIHADQLGLDCRYCHNGVESSWFSNIPSSSTCMNCHSQVKTDSPALALIRRSVETGEAVRWVKVHKVPDYVYFNHAVHVNRGVSCVECHGRIDQMEIVAQQQPLSMSWCLDCHNNPAPNLRPIDQVTNMTWEPDAAWSTKAAEIAHDLHPPGNKNAAEVLPDGQVIVRATAGCTGCHR